MIIKGRRPTLRHVSRTHRVAIDWLFDRINFDPQNPNQIRWRQKPTRRHFDQRKLQTRWMESPFSSIQHQPFQPSKLHTSDVEKDCKKVIVKQGLPPNRDLWEIWYPGISTVPFSTASASPRNFGSESHELDLKTGTGERVAILSETETNEGDKNVEFSRVAHRCEIDGKHGGTRYTKFCHWRRFGDIRRIQSSFCRISLIHRKSEYEIASDVERSSRRQDGWHWQTLSCLGNMHVFNKERSRFSWTRLLRKSAVHQTYRWETYRKEFVRSDSKIGNLRSVRNKLGNFSVGKAVPGERRRSK